MCIGACVCVCVCVGSRGRNVFPPVQNLLVVSLRVAKSWKMHMRVDKYRRWAKVWPYVMGVFADCRREGSDE